MERKLLVNHKNIHNRIIEYTTILKYGMELLEGYKNKYEGKRCFIVGNGPSLRVEDLEKVKNEITFAFNGIFKIFPYTEWRPTFYCIQDGKVLDSFKAEELAFAANTSQCTFMTRDILDKYNLFCAKLTKCVYLRIINPDKRKRRFKFRENINKGYMNGCTVTYMAMQIAAYMGFAEVYLLGVDHNFPYRKDDTGKLYVNDLSLKSHFYEPKDSIGLSQQFMGNYHDAVTRAYQKAQMYCEEHDDFQIYNSTRGGVLEVFPRVELESLFSARPL